MLSPLVLAHLAGVGMLAWLTAMGVLFTFAIALIRRELGKARLLRRRKLETAQALPRKNGRW